MIPDNISNKQVSYILEWFRDCGVDEAFDEFPRSRLIRNETAQLVGPNDLDKTINTAVVGDIIKPIVFEESDEVLNINVKAAKELAGECNSVSTLVEAIKNFAQFKNLTENPNVSFYEGKINAKVLVFIEPRVYESRNNNETQLDLKKSLFVKIFDSIGLNLLGEGDNALCSISCFPWFFEDITEIKNYNFSVMRPFLWRYIEIIKPLAIITMGHSLSENLEVTKTSIEIHKFFKDIIMINVPSLDVLSRASKRKKVVWEELSMLKQKLLEKKK